MESKFQQGIQGPERGPVPTRTITRMIRGLRASRQVPFLRTPRRGSLLCTWVAVGPAFSRCGPPVLGRLPAPWLGEQAPPRSLIVAGTKPADAPDTHEQQQPGHRFDSISIQRQPTSSTTVSSPGKHNDALSDEILRSLSPGAGSFAGDGRDTILAPNPDPVRESSYTLRDYESYWADTSDKVRPAPAFPATLDGKGVAGSASETPGPREREGVEEPDSRKRFSWKADEDMANPPSPDPVLRPSISKELAVLSEPGHSLQLNGFDNGAPPRVDADCPVPDSGTRITSKQEREPQQIPQPPSPMSTPSDKMGPAGSGSTRLSQSDEGALAPDTAGVFSPTPPPESQTSPAGFPRTVLTDPQSPHYPTKPPSMTFHEILGLPTLERIARFDETRNYFASTESGLDTWLAALQAENPDFALGPELLAPAVSQAESNPPPSATNMPPAQQSYYQQHLHASAPGTSSAGRSRLGSLPMASQSVGGAFGHPSNQISFKSKEFMHSAGKMGKGLLNKGKNKLRGSGDKVFH